jgi:hypothetical protein
MMMAVKGLKARYEAEATNEPVNPLKGGNRALRRTAMSPKRR